MGAQEARDDVCPYCLRFEGMRAEMARGTRFCPLCGGDWSAMEDDVFPDEDSVVMPALDASAEANVRPPSTTGKLRIVGATDLDPARDTGEHPRLQVTSGTPPPAAPTLPPPAPTPPPVVVAARRDGGRMGPIAWVLALLVIILAGVGGGVLGSALLSSDETPVAVAPPAPAAPAVVDAAPPPPDVPPLPSPADSPQRRALAVRQAIDHALRESPPETLAELDVRVDEDIAYLSGKVDGNPTLQRVTLAAGQVFGVRAVDTRGIEIGERMHIVERGETLGEIAEAHYGDSAMWVYVWRSNPRIDPHRIEIGQPLVLPPRVGAGEAMRPLEE